MEKVTRRRCIRRQQELEVPVERRDIIERRVFEHRSGFDRREQQSEVSDERRSGKDRRAEE